MRRRALRHATRAQLAHRGARLALHNVRSPATDVALVSAIELALLRSIARNVEREQGRV